MKHTLKLAAVAAALCIPCASGATYIADNIAGISSNVVVDNMGNFVTDANGITAMGFLAISDGDLAAINANGVIQPGEWANILANWTQFGSTVPFAAPEGIFTMGGAFSNQQPNVNVGGTPADGSGIYILVALGGDLASASEAAILRSTTASYAAAVDDSATIIQGTFNASDDVLIGGVGNFNVQPTSVPAGTQPAFNTIPIVPEPSSSLLFGAAGLALLLRRKR